MSQEPKEGSRTLTFILVLVFLIPIITISIFWIRSFIAKTNTKQLPEGSFSTKLREVVELDKEGREIRYWVLDTTNHTKNNLYNCLAEVSSKGEQDKFIGFSSNYVLKDCKALSKAKDNYDCRLTNMLTRWRSYEKSRTWDRLNASGHLVIGVGRFYVDQTVSSQSFLSKNRLSDLDTLTLNCQTESGGRVVGISSVQ